MGRPAGAALRVLAALTCAGMLLVLVMGAAVTNTGSAEGCGRSWPLCNGQFIPEFTVATAIEFSHRAVTGIESVLVLALTATMLVLWRRNGQAVLLAVVMLGTLLLQAGLGAGAVLWPQSALMLATHFGVSLMCFAATFLSAALVWERTPRRRHPPPAALQYEGASVTGSVTRTPSAPDAASGTGMPGSTPTAGVTPTPSASLAASVTGMARVEQVQGHRALTLAVTAYVLVVVYLGAYVRHSGVSLACLDWPLCNGQVVPPLEEPTGIVFAHRVAAAVAVLLLGVLAYRLPSARWAFGLSVLQALSGALVVWTLLGLFSTLLHAAIMGLLFAALAYVVRAELNTAAPTDYRVFSNRLWQSTHSVASGRASSRSGGMPRPHSWHTP